MQDRNLAALKVELGNLQLYGQTIVLFHARGIAEIMPVSANHLFSVAFFSAIGVTALFRSHISSELYGW